MLLEQTRQAVSTPFFAWENDAEKLLQQMVSDVCRRLNKLGNITVETSDNEYGAQVEVAVFIDHQSMVRHTLSVADLQGTDKNLLAKTSHQCTIGAVLTVFEVGLLGNIPGRAEIAQQFSNIVEEGRTRILDWRC